MAPPSSPPVALPLSTGSTFYVSRAAGASDSNTGTEASPWLTINKALAAPAGSKVLIKDGVYTEAVSSTRAASATGVLTIENYPGHRPLIQRTIELRNGARYLRFRGLILDGGGTTRGAWGFAIRDGVQDVEISYNEIRGWDGGSGVSGGMTMGDSPGPCTNVHVFGNLVYDNGKDANLDHGIYMEEADGCFIANNAVWNNTAYGIQCYPRSKRNLIAHNTLENNGRGSIVCRGSTQVDNIIANNVMANERKGLGVAVYIADVGSGNQAVNNVAFNCLEAFKNEGGTWSGNTTGDPLFVSPSTHDYRLQAGSKAIGAADSRYSPALDALKTTRSAPFDAGAYEFGGIPVPTSLRLWTVGDGEADSNAQAVVSMIQSRGKGEALLYLGDVYVDAGTTWAQWGNVWDVLEPIWPTSGDHEWATRTTGYDVHHAGKGITPPATRYYSKVFGDWKVIVLQTMDTGSEGAISATQMAWFQNELASTGKQKIIVAHHPAYSADTDHPNYAGMAEVVTAAKDKAVLILSGDGHTMQVIGPDTNGVEQWVVGTGGRALDPLSSSEARLVWSQNTSFGACEITLEANQLTGRFYSSGGTLLQTRTVAGNATGGGGGTTPPPAADFPSFASFASGQVTDTATAVTTTQYPWHAAAATWTTTAASAWTSGFWPGNLWLEYERTGTAFFRTEAEAHQAAIAAQATVSTHDLGFQFMSSYGHDYRLTGNTTARSNMLTAATTLAARYSATVQMIRAANTTGSFNTLVDTMMNLELLFWSAANGGPASHRDVAIAHALKTRTDHVRANGSTYQVVNYSESTGAVTSKATNQGSGTETTWSRGHAWAIHGFAQTYRDTLDARFLATARLCADYWIANVPSDKVPYWDFSQSGSQPRDSSAASIAASGMLELARVETDAGRRTTYYDFAVATMTSLISPAYSADGTTSPGLILHGASNVPSGTATNAALIQGDYYMLQALQRYRALATPPSTGPAVTWVTPAQGATITGSASFEVTASSDAGVERVEFSVDNDLRFVERVAPWRPATAWDSRTVVDGGHTLSAKAFDAAGGTTTRSITITTSNGIGTGGGGGGTPPAGLIWRGDADVGTIAQEWEGASCVSLDPVTGRVRQVTATDSGAAPMQGAKCYRLEIRNGDDPLGEGRDRCEIGYGNGNHISGSPWSGSDRQYHLGDDVWIPMGLYLQTFDAAHGGDQTWWQIGKHDGTGPSTLNFRLQSGSWRLTGTNDSSRGGDASAITHFTRTYSSSHANRWLKFMMHIKFGTSTSTGILDAWADFGSGWENIVPSKGAVTMKTESGSHLPVQPRWGIYRPDGGGGTYIVYYDGYGPATNRAAAEANAFGVTSGGGTAPLPTGPVIEEPPPTEPPPPDPGVPVPAGVTFSDTFDDGVIDAAKWPTAADVTEVGGRGRVPAAPDTRQLASAAQFKLAGAQVQVQLAAVPTDADASSTFGVSLNVDNEITFVKLGANLVMRSRTNGAASDTSITYSSTTHSHLRISEAAGTLTWWTSPDANTWTSRRTLATPGWVTTSTALKIVLRATDPT